MKPKSNGKMKKIGFGFTLIVLSLISAWILYFNINKLKVRAEPEKKPICETEKSTGFSELFGRIIFQSNRDGDEEIYVMNPKGEEIVQLTSNNAFDGYPVWSMDGARIAFESNRNGSFQIYTMDQDGKNQMRITGGLFENRYPSWSPDGKFIAYQSKRKNGEQIYAMDLERKNEQTITHAWYKCGLPNWSPDGKKIAFTANKLIGWGVYIMDRDGSNVEALDTESGACRPHWSKDGKYIAYVSQKADNKGDIWIINPDGSGKRRMTTDSMNFDYYPSWSPDGKWIVYANTSHKQKGNWEIRIIHVATGESKQITNHSAQDMYPDWH